MCDFPSSHVDGSLLTYKLRPRLSPPAPAFPKLLLAVTGASAIYFQLKLTLSSEKENKKGNIRLEDEESSSALFLPALRPVSPHLGR